MMQWIFSKVQYFSEYLTIWDETLRKDFEEQKSIERFIGQMEDPFSFLTAMRAQEMEDNDIDDDAPAEGAGATAQKSV
jgi:hypothetical protein